MCLCSSLRFEKKQKNLQQKRRKVQESLNRTHIYTYLHMVLSRKTAKKQLKTPVSEEKNRNQYNLYLIVFEFQLMLAFMFKC